MRSVLFYFDKARKAINEERLSWNDVKEQTKKSFDKLWKLKFEVIIFYYFVKI